MKLPDSLELQKVYDILGDSVSKDIYRHRLLYSLLGEKEEITKMVYECSPASALLSTSKVCYYGAGAGGGWLVQYNRNASFVIDKYKTGTFGGLPILSLDDFLKLSDCKEYLIVITVGKENIRKEIAAELDSHGLQYLFAYFDMQYFDLQYFDLQYFDLRNEYFVDVGALDGETTMYFLEHFKNGHAYVLEPNPAQFAVTKKRLRNRPEAELFPYGAYDQNTMLRFDTSNVDAGSARVSETGTTEIEVRKLDDLLKDRKVTFLKMDIEGSELAALRGAERIIREQRPKLAVCVYHKPEDIWEIPSLILQYHPDYKLYLRHYSISYTETVLYAI
ncbi:MAG: FkbM family methyltransferase [Oscillospiraceae bacterium]|nr:FkbM family methyltransferase [Oscillospiraceae bacterium]